MAKETEYLNRQELYAKVMEMDKQDQMKFESGKLKKAEIHRLIDTTFEAIMSAVSEGKEVRITGFGTFKPAFRQAREGRNPQTGDSLEIPARWVPKFSAGKKFKIGVEKLTK